MHYQKISEETFNHFVEHHQNFHYKKLSYFGKYQQHLQNDQFHLLGFYEQEQLVATALVLENTWLSHHYFYIPTGPCMDYTNLDLVSHVLTLLKQFADEHRVLFLRIDPNVIRMHKTIDGEVIDDGFNQEYITDFIVQQGFVHKGYGYAYNGSWANRFTLIINLSSTIEEIQKRFEKKHIPLLKKQAGYQLETKVGTQKDIPYIMELEKQLAAKEGFKPHSFPFFKNIFDVYKEHAIVYKTTVKLNQIITYIQNELNSKKYNKDLPAKLAKEKELQYYLELIKKYPDEIVLACGVYLQFGQYCWDLYTYNHKEFGHLGSPVNLHAFAITDMKKRGVIYYDMVGFSGSTSKDDLYYGLYQFKRSFGPEYTEYIGEFDYVRHSKTMQRFRKERLLINRIKNKIYRTLYQKNK